MRTSRALAALAVSAVGTSSLLVLGASPASAATLGGVNVSPATGTTGTSFGGSVNASCPAGTNDAYFSITGPGVDSALGEGFLGAGSNTSGTGPQSFSGASIANLNSVDGTYGAGTYEIAFNCVNGATITDKYTASFVYDPAGNSGAGSYSATANAADPIATSVSLAASPTTAFAGDVVTLSATVSPAVSVGQVDFYDGATLLGTDTSVASGAASFAWTTSTTGARSITAVYSDASNTYSGSTSAPVTVTVDAVPNADTTTTLTVSPTSGDAYVDVTQTCTVARATGTGAAPTGSVQFKDGTSVLATVPLASGTATFTSNAFAPGAHSFTCDYPGAAGFNASTSAPVSASYVQAGASTTFNATVTIPAGAITITTPFSPTNPLSLGTAVYDSGTSTYAAAGSINGIVITDTRAGRPGFTAKIVAGTFTGPNSSSFAGSYAGLTDLVANQVAGNALQAGDVALTNIAPNTPGLGSLTTFATYPAGASSGSVSIDGVLRIAGVPTSVSAGLFTSLITLTAV